MVKSNTKQLRLPLDEWDIFNSYAENREDEELSPMSTHWTLTAASVAEGFPIPLDRGPKSADSTEDPYYKQAYVKPTLQARFADTQTDTSTLIFKLRKRRKQNMSIDAGRDARTEDDGIRAIISAAHNQASKSKKAFGKMFSQLTNRDETEKEKENNKKFFLKSAGPVEGDARGARDHYFFTCNSAMPTRPAKLKRTKSDYGQENQRVLDISAPILVVPPPPRSPPPLPPTIGRATTFVRKTKALPLRPSPIPAI